MYKKNYPVEAVNFGSSGTSRFSELYYSFEFESNDESFYLKTASWLL